MSKPMTLKPPESSRCPRTKTAHESANRIYDLFNSGVELLLCKNCGLVYWQPEGAEPVAEVPRHHVLEINEALNAVLVQLEDLSQEQRLAVLDMAVSCVKDWGAPKTSREEILKKCSACGYESQWDGSCPKCGTP